MKSIKTIIYSILISLIAVNNFAFAKETTAPRLPVETFFKYSDFDHMVLSPTGKYLAVRLRMDGSKKLAIMETKTNKVLSVSHFGDDSDVGDIGWLTDERAYAEMVTRVGPLDEPRMTGFLFAVNADGSKKRQLLPTPPRPGKAVGQRKWFSIVDKLPEDEKNVLIYISNNGFMTYSKLNIFSGKQKVYQKAPEAGASMYMDHDNVVRVYIDGDYDIDEDTYTKEVFYRDSKDDDWQLIETIIDKNTRSEGRSSYRVKGFTPDNKKFYVYSNRTISLYDPKTNVYNEIHRLNGDADVTNFVFSFDYKTPELIGIKRAPGYVESVYFDKSNPDVRLRRSMEAAFPNSVVTLINRTQDGKTTLVYVYDDKNSGTYYLYDSEKKSLSYLMATAPERDQKQMGTMKPFSFIARDGLEIRGYLTLPKGKSKNLPLVQVVHGGPYGVTDNYGFDKEAQFFANRGYAVMQVNYRGSGGRGIAFELGNYLKMGKEMQNDLTDAVHWGIEQGIVNKNKVCIYGASYGGYAALMGVVMEPDLYQCAVPYVGVYDIAIQKDKSDTRLSEQGRNFLKDAWNAYDEDFVKERSPIYHLDKLKAALFFVHGAKDRRVPIENYEAVSEKLDEMGYPYESLIEEHEAHGFREQENIYNLYRKVGKFLDKYLGE